MNDIHYRALNKLKNSKIEDSFQGELSVRVNRKRFCRYCLFRHLIRFSSPTEDMELIKVNEYKEFLRNHSLKVSGKKSDLAKRVFDYDPTFFGKKHYIITEKGMKILQKHWNKRASQNVLSTEDLHDRKLKKYNVCEEDFTRIDNSLPFKAHENDVIWGALNERVLTHSFSKNYFELRNDYLDMGLLLEEEKNYSRAIEYFLMTTCFDINGYTSFYKHSGKTSSPILIPWICDRIYFLRSFYSPVLAEVAYSQCLIEKEWITESEFIALVNDIVTSDTRIHYTKAQELLKKYTS